MSRYDSPSFAAHVRTVVLVLLVSTLLAVLAAPVSAQIVVDRSFFENRIGDRYRTTEYEAVDPETLRTVVEADGEDATYDFTSATYDTTLQGQTEYIELPADLPGADDESFQDANLAIRVDWEAQVADTAVTDSTAWIYQNLTDEALDVLGFIYLADPDGEGTQDTLKLSYEPGLRDYELPEEYGDQWESSSLERISFGGFQFEDSVRYEYEVEGYGELVTPSGTVQALRERMVVYSGVGSGSDTTDSTTYLNFLTVSGFSAQIELDSAGNAVYASYTYQERVATSTEEVTELPAGYELDQNYPNPFNPSTTITFQVPRRTHVTLRVVDLLGRTVRVPVDGWRSAGTHRISFDGTGLPSGMYFYRLEAPSFRQTRAMVLSK